MSNKSGGGGGFRSKGVIVWIVVLNWVDIRSCECVYVCMFNHPLRVSALGAPFYEQAVALINDLLHTHIHTAPECVSVGV